MCRQAGEPMNGNTEHADPAIRDDYPEELDDMEETEDYPDEQDEDTYRILAILNQEHLTDAFDEDGTASEDETPEFSQAFMDGMRTMVADRYGQEAAERFMTQNNNKKNKKESHHQPKTVPEIKKPMSQVHAPMDEAEETLGAERSLKKKHFHMGALLSTWPRRVAVILVVLVLTFGIYQGSVQATKLPTVDFNPLNMDEYSKVGSLKDIISNLDITNYPQELEHVYVPRIVAEGYEEADRIEESKYINVVYENDDGQWYRYRQMTVGANTFLDTEQGEWKAVDIKECPGLYISKDDEGKLWWFDYQYAYQIQGNLIETEMVRIAESLHEVTE